MLKHDLTKNDVRKADTQDDLSRIYTAFAWFGMSTLSKDGATALDAMKGIVEKKEAQTWSYWIQVFNMGFSAFYSLFRERAYNVLLFVTSYHPASRSRSRCR
jgi:hypothetical protein